MNILIKIICLLLFSFFVGCSSVNVKHSNTPFLPGLERSDGGPSRQVLDKSNDSVPHEDQVTTRAAKSKSPDQIHGTAQLDSSSVMNKNVYFLYGAEHLKLENNYFDIPVVYNSAVKKWINYFLGRGKQHFLRYAERAGRYGPLLGKILESHGLPRDLIFLAMAESGFQNHIKSRARAVGPWQFMPTTAKRYGLNINWYKDERRDPIKSTIAACRYLKKLYNQFGHWELATAAYNAGEGKISRAIRYYGTRNYWKLRRGRYLKHETKNYVPKIMAMAIIGKNLKSFGLNEINFFDPLEFDEVTVTSNTDLMQLAQDIDIPYDKLSYYNPELLRWVTPPGDEEYSLRLPPGHLDQYMACCKDMDYRATKFQVYTVRGNSSLFSVSKKFRLKANVLASLNNVPAQKKFRRGDSVLLPFRVGQEHRDPMYKDLYELPRRKQRARQSYRARISLAKRRGVKITNPQGFYVVQKGDTLWDVSRKAGISLDNLIKSNLTLVSMRMIREGDRLIVK